MTDPTGAAPAWLGNASIGPARNERGEIIGVILTCLVVHDDIALLPPPLLDSCHSVLDRAAAKDAAND